MNEKFLKKTGWIYLLYFCAILTAYCLFLKQTYCMDMFPYYGRPVTLWDVSLESFHPIQAFQLSSSQGRYFFMLRYIVDFVLFQFGIHLTRGQFVLQLIGMASLAGAGTVLYSTFARELPDAEKRVLFLGILLGVVNPGFAEILVFVCYDFCWAMLFAALAIRSFFRERNVCSFLWLLLSIGTYQSYYSTFLIYIFSLLFLKARGVPTKRLMRDGAKAIGIDAAAVLLSLILTKIFTSIWGVKSQRSVSIAQGAEILKRIKRMIPRYGLNALTGGGVLPTGFLPICVLLLVLISMLLLGKRNGGKSVVFYVIYVFVLVSLPVVVTLFEKTPYVPARILTGAYGVVGCLFLIALLISEKMPVVLSPILRAVLTCYVLVMMLSVIGEASDILTANALEKSTCAQVQHEIEAYEEETGENIEKIGVIHYRDEGQPIFDHANFQFFGPYYYTAHLFLYTTWSDVVAVNYFNGTDYERFTMTEEEAANYFPDFAMESLASFDPHAQLVFDGNTMYWILY